MLLPIPNFVKFIAKIYVLAIVVLAILRALLFYYCIDDPSIFYKLNAYTCFAIGLQFDTVILCYILVLPLLLLFIQAFFNFIIKPLQNFITYYLVIVFTALFFLVIADIPYFKFYHNRITESSLQWMDNPKIILHMIVGNSTHLLFLILAVSFSFFVGFFTYRFCRKSLLLNKQQLKKQYAHIVNVIYFLLLALMAFMGMRGKLNHPIMVGDAFYSNNPVLNQIGLNPIFTLMKSYFSKLELMDDVQAIHLSKQFLNIKKPITSISSIAREVKFNETSQKYNIVLVLMEGMSAHFMQRFGNEIKVTPTLDSLASNSLFFTNAYSAGIHTNNGIFSTLYSFPALTRIRPMNTIPVRKYSGLPYTLKQYDYTNLFFCTHSQSFDNLGDFIPNNSFDEFYASEHFPAEKSVGPFGVPDDYLFGNVVDRLNELDTTKLFFASILTASNHDPYILPNYFKSEIQDKELRAVSYADWSISQFLQRASSSTWFNKTIFVFVADHGRIVGNPIYDMPLARNHIPIIIYSPGKQIPNSVNESFVGQIDVFPTLMGLLKLNYINNTMGNDAIAHPRSMMYFSADDKMACISSKYLYVYRFDGKESLYQYSNNDLADYFSDHTDAAKSLKAYVFSQTQTTSWMISNNKTEVK